MDRLLRAVDRLHADGVLHGEVIIQSAAYGFRPPNAVLEGVRSYAWLADKVSGADTVISHAGPATLALVRAAGRVPVVVPRSSAEGEHVDDHQLRYADRLRGQPGYAIVTDMSKLAEAIESARGVAANPIAADVSRAVAVLNALLTTAR